MYKEYLYAHSQLGKTLHHIKKKLISKGAKHFLSNEGAWTDACTVVTPSLQVQTGPELAASLQVSLPHFKYFSLRTKTMS